LSSTNTNSIETMLTMNKIFLDTNILLYIYATDADEKTKIAEKIVLDHDNLTISTQVLFEFSNIMHKKLKQDSVAIDSALEEFNAAFNIAIIRYETIRNALQIVSRYKYSLPDSLIIVTALEYNCDILFSEDMHHNQLIDHNLKIINPFKS
jgi:predicted nucleic acid-binding protein